MTLVEPLLTAGSSRRRLAGSSPSCASRSNPRCSRPLSPRRASSQGLEAAVEQAGHGGLGRAELARRSRPAAAPGDGASRSPGAGSRAASASASASRRALLLADRPLAGRRLFGSPATRPAARPTRPAPRRATAPARASRFRAASLRIASARLWPRIDRSQAAVWASRRGRGDRGAPGRPPAASAGRPPTGRPGLAAPASTCSRASRPR